MNTVDYAHRIHVSPCRITLRGGPGHCGITLRGVMDITAESQQRDHPAESHSEEFMDIAESHSEGSWTLYHTRNVMDTVESNAGVPLTLLNHTERHHKLCGITFRGIIETPGSH
jgi:hypothetical protein